MAEFKYTPLCVCGRPLKVFKSSGRVQKACSMACYGISTALSQVEERINPAPI